MYVMHILPHSLCVQVKSQEQAAVYFPLIPSAVGAVDIEVSARSTLSADAVRRQLVVEVSMTSYVCRILALEGSELPITRAASANHNVAT